MKTRVHTFLYILALFALLPTAVFGMTSTNYQILWDSINSGGLDESTSTNYLLRDTIGEHATGFSGSTNYAIGAGYRTGDRQEPTLSISIGTREDSTRSAWTAFSDGGNTVTVSDPSSFSVNDFIGVVENEGFAQLLAVGIITDVTGNVVTVDAWSGEPSSISATASGDDDYAYRMNGYAATLGTLTLTSEHTSMTMTDIATNLVNGYTVSVQGDDDLRADGSRMTAVSDGTVSLGEEEYGIETVGAFGVGTGSDLSIPTSTTRTVQSSSTYGEDERVGVIYKLAISETTAYGSYSQSVVYRLTGNF